MAREVFNLSNLPKLDDGKVIAMFQKEMKRAVLDCNDRPADKTARKVMLTVSVTPSGEGVIEAVNLEFECKTSIPPRRTRPYEMAPHASGQLIFNPASDDDVHQGTLDEARSGEDE